MTTETHPQLSVSSKPPFNQKVVFAIVASALLMMTIDSTIVATALHALQTDLNTTVNWAGWTMTAYSFGFILMLPLSAKLSTQLGHKRVFLSSVITFTIASVLCGLSSNIEMLIAMRVLQAVGGSGITPSATGLIVSHFSTNREKYLGLFGSMFSIGSMVGPMFGGLIVSYWSWHWVFFINIPIGIAILLLAGHFIPKAPRIQRQREKTDIVGLLLLAAGIISIMLTASYMGESVANIRSALFLILLASSIISFVLFFTHLKRSEHPFINPRFITGKGFGAVNLVNTIHTGMVIGTASLVPFYAISRYGIDELSAGTLLVIEGVSSVVVSIVMSFYLHHTGYRKPIYVGAAFLALGALMLAIEPLWGTGAFGWLAAATFLVGFGFGFMSPAARNAGIQLAPQQSANLAAIRSLGLQMGQIVSIAIATAIISASTNPGHAQGMVYLGLTILLTTTIPIVSKVPEKKGTW